MANKITIIGAGPAGLFCSELLIAKGYEVDLYDQSSGPAKKFLIAGNGGLNLTHSESLDLFCSRYGQNELFFKDLLKDFTPEDLRSWCKDLGVETFIGSSGRVFPAKLKAGEILVKWLKKLKQSPNFSLKLNHSLISITTDKKLTFLHNEERFEEKCDVIIFALGGASWPNTGSDGKWLDFLKPLEIKIIPLLPMNCGFELSWSNYFAKEIGHHPLKNVSIEFDGRKIRGEIMLTPYGIEGGSIYALSNLIRDEIIKNSSATIWIDLKPDLSHEELRQKMAIKKPKSSLSNHLRKSLGLGKEAFVLLKEVMPNASEDEYISLIKKLPLILKSMRPIEEAISSSGGVSFSELNANLESIKHPGVFFAGEMLDFEAPTGGYLLQACFSTSFRIAKGFDDLYKSS